ncbi:MAG: haloacid dehalogenase-like hydrolase [Bacilli bacterium]|nr:haloacid dehalogenase-like hydrolase [Bacilli bacterium]
MEEKKKHIIALMYDFDKTLCTKDMQEYSFIDSIGMEAAEFWDESNKLSVKNDMDRILAYMYLMMKQAKKKDVPITKDAFVALGKDVVLCKGVKTWFKRINEFGRSLGVEIEHYILSSGLKEIIEGTPIAKEFKKIYACEFHYNASGNADWPKQTVNYTTKTQFIFRISKGVLDVLDDVKLNTKMKDDDRRIPYQNMIYFGDGLTDVPCMKLVKQYGGHSIAIFNRKEKQKVEPLLRDDRVNFICEGDYRKDKRLEQIVQQIIKKVVADNELNDISKEQVKMKRY